MGASTLDPSISCPSSVMRPRSASSRGSDAWRLLAAHARAMTLDVRQSGPTGKSLLIYRNHVKPRNKKYFAFSEPQISLHIFAHPVPLRGALAIVTIVGRGAVDADVATDERGRGVRQKRVVLTPRCWRQCSWGNRFQGATVAKEPSHRGELAISRKAIAQGMSDVLRCPVCSCAASFCTLHTRPRVQRASGIPCALWILGGEEFARPGRKRAAGMRSMFSRHRPRALIRDPYASGPSVRVPALETFRNNHRRGVWVPASMRRDDG